MTANNLIFLFAFILMTPTRAATKDGFTDRVEAFNQGADLSSMVSQMRFQALKLTAQAKTDSQDPQKAAAITQQCQTFCHEIAKYGATGVITPSLKSAMKNMKDLSSQPLWQEEMGIMQESVSAFYASNLKKKVDNVINQAKPYAKSKSDQQKLETIAASLNKEVVSSLEQGGKAAPKIDSIIDSLEDLVGKKKIKSAVAELNGSISQFAELKQHIGFGQPPKTIDTELDKIQKEIDKIIPAVQNSEMTKTPLSSQISYAVSSVKDAVTRSKSNYNVDLMLKSSLAQLQSIFGNTDVGKKISKSIDLVNKSSEQINTIIDQSHTVRNIIKSNELINQFSKDSKRDINNLKIMVDQVTAQAETITRASSIPNSEISKTINALKQAMNSSLALGKIDPALSNALNQVRILFPGSLIDNMAGSAASIAKQLSGINKEMEKEQNRMTKIQANTQYSQQSELPTTQEYTPPTIKSTPEDNTISVQSGPLIDNRWFANATKDELIPNKDQNQQPVINASVAITDNKTPVISPSINNSVSTIENKITENQTSISSRPAIISSIPTIENKISPFPFIAPDQNINSDISKPQINNQPMLNNGPPLISFNSFNNDKPAPIINDKQIATLPVLQVQPINISIAQSAIVQPADPAAALQKSVSAIETQAKNDLVDNSRAPAMQNMINNLKDAANEAIRQGAATDKLSNAIAGASSFFGHPTWKESVNNIRDQASQISFNNLNNEANQFIAAISDVKPTNAAQTNQFESAINFFKQAVSSSLEKGKLDANLETAITALKKFDTNNKLDNAISKIKSSMQQFKIGTEKIGLGKPPQTMITSGPVTSEPTKISSEAIPTIDVSKVVGVAFAHGAWNYFTQFMNNQNHEYLSQNNYSENKNTGYHNNTAQEYQQNGYTNNQFNQPDRSQWNVSYIQQDRTMTNNNLQSAQDQDPRVTAQYNREYRNQANGQWNRPATINDQRQFALVLNTPSAFGATKPGTPERLNTPEKNRPNVPVNFRK